MAARSVTRELGSPALPDLTSRSRRSSSRASQASQRTAQPEVNTSNLPQSSYSLPPTPLTSSFDESVPSKRRRTQRAIHSEDKTFPSKSALETPTHRAFSEPSQTPKSTKPTRNSNLILSTSQSSGAVKSPQQASTPGGSKADPAFPADQPQPEQGITSSRKPSLRNQTITVKPEPLEANKDTGMGASMSHTRKTRQSISTRHDHAGQENGTPSKTSTADTNTPLSARRDRRSRLAASTGTKITNPSPATPTAVTAKTPNGVNKSAASAKQSPAETPSTFTRSRRRDRRSTQARSLDNGSESVAAQINNEQISSQRPSRLRNTVTLNVGRKSLETILAQKPNQNSHDDDVNVAPPENDYHFEYDSEMYRNNYGLDGQMDAPTSPNSMSTTTSTAARTSRRTRKPTIRALESFESEQRYRRPAKSSTADTNTNTNIPETRTRSRQKPNPQPPASTTSVPTPDINALAKHIYELAAAAVADDFVLPPETEKWFKELQQKFDEQQNKEAEPTELAEPAEPVEPAEVVEPSPSAGEVAEPEDTTSPNKAFLDNIQASAPWTDSDGWVHTGQHNKHGEEFLIVGPKFEWYRPNYTYGDKSLPPPPARLRSYAQSEADRVFGYPPCIGDRNVPADLKNVFLLENVPEERAKLKAKEAARARGIIVTRYMPLHEIELLISLYDNGQPPPPPAPAPESIAESKPAVSTRKRRRTDTTSTSKPTEPTETPRPKRRRQETGNLAPPEPLAPELASEPPTEPSTEEPSPPEKKSLKITLTFGKNKYLLEHVAPGNNETTPQHPKKRPHPEAGDTTNTPERTHGHDTRSPRILTHAADKATTQNGTQSMGVPSTPASKPGETKTDTPGSFEQFSTETTPGGRPRRRAAAALMAGFQTHAEDRARRAERARAAHARRKGTPLKNVTTAINESPVESSVRPAFNPLNFD
ncbi:hypothetical protein BJX63DRAFT_203425 [Aspergillus granulosus]|uniref:GPI-anchored cell surface glycoprotein n=1 Tax=Aspergillus granulosus TaxID=176169 RepID=A0ABR4HFR6_9EURO